MTVTVAKVKTLLDELATLSRQQSEAMETAVYLTMSKAETAEYNNRGERISELRELLRANTGA